MGMACPDCSTAGEEDAPLNARVIGLREATVVAEIHRLVVKPSRLLDLGCGPRQYRGVHSGWYLGVDVTTKDYRPGIPRSPDVVGSGLALPFVDASFDVVMIGGLVHTIGDLNTLLDEVHRVLIVDGLVIVFDYSRRTGMTLAQRYQLRDPAITSHPRSCADLRETLYRCGFGCVDVRRRSTRPIWAAARALVPRRLYERILDEVPGALSISGVARPIRASNMSR